MLSSDKNVESLARLIETLKDYIGLQKEYLKFDVIDKLVRLITALSLSIIVMVLVLAVLFYLSFAFVYWISPAVGTACAFAIVAGVLLLLLIAIFAMRRPLIIRPLIWFITGILLSK